MTDYSLKTIKGIGPKREEGIHKLDIYTVEQLFSYYPKKYKDMSQTSVLSQIEDNTAVLVKGRIVSKLNVRRIRGNRTISSVEITDESGMPTECIWFFRVFTDFKVNDIYYFAGIASKNGARLQIKNAEFEKGEASRLKGIKPVYRLNASLSQNTYRSIVRNALLQYGDSVEDDLPESLKQRYNLCDKKFMLKSIHCPESMHHIEVANRRVAFEELLLYQSAIKLFLQEQNKKAGFSFKITDEMIDSFIKNLTFELTGAQRAVMQEVVSDMRSTQAMNRIVQGDVGCGKTIIAFFALYIAVLNNKQAVMLAPTELLAKQHYTDAVKVFKAYDIEVGLLTGSLTSEQKNEALQNIKSGKAQIIIGTHALFQNGIEYHDLGLAITDEQHRFGVRQRASIATKGNNPDLLIMSATPIPRTLSLIALGDLNISVINEMPKGRKRVRTNYVPTGKIGDMYKFAAEQAKQGRQGYIVCPLINDSDDIEAHSVTEVYNRLTKNELKGLRLALLHSDLKNEAKNEIVNNFAEGSIDIVVSTIVVEVGVNVPNASFMIIYDAERFGLAQLHQLRGRVGRGRYESYCFLLSESKAETALERLRILCATDDGFELAQKDLELRNTGDFLGVRQSGVPMQDTMRYMSDKALVEETKKAVDQIFNDKNHQSELEKIKELVKTKYHERLNEIILN